MGGTEEEQGRERLALVTLQTSQDSHMPWYHQASLRGSWSTVVEAPEHSWAVGDAPCKPRKTVFLFPFLWQAIPVTMRPGAIHGQQKIVDKRRTQHPLKMLKKCQKSLVLSMKNVSMCTFKTSPFVPAPRAHMLKHLCAWCRQTRGRFERTHGDVLSGHTGFFSVSHSTHNTTTQHITTTQHNTSPQHNTTQHLTQHHTETETVTDREREKTGTEREEKTEEDKTRKEKREDSFSVWWCMAVF